MDVEGTLMEKMEDKFEVTGQDRARKKSIKVARGKKEQENTQNEEYFFVIGYSF